MTTRITGLVSGLDVDSLVEAGTSFYQGKLDEAKQKQQKLQWEQTAYQSIATDTTTFYSKYLDITSDNCITKSSNWNINTYTSSNASAVTATGGSGTAIDNYKVSVAQLASAANTTLSSSQLTSNSLVIADSNGSTTIDLSSYTTNSDRVAAINSALSTKGIKVTASCSDISGQVTLQANTMGSSVSFSVDGTTVQNGTNLHATITSSSGTYTMSDTKNTTTSNTVTLDNITFNFNEVTTSTSSGAAQNITSSSIASLLGNDITNVGTSNSTVYTLSNGSKITIGNDGTTTVTASDGKTKLSSGQSVNFTDSNGTKITIGSDGKLTTTTQSTSSQYVSSLSLNTVLGNDITSSTTDADGNNQYTLSDGSVLTISKVDGSALSLSKGGTTYSTSNPGGVSFTSANGSTINLQFNSSGLESTTTTSATSTNYITSSSINNLLESDINNVSETSNSIYTLSNGSKITIGSDGTTTVTGTDGTTALSGGASISYQSSDGSTKTITMNSTGTGATMTTSSNSDNPVTLTGSTDVSDIANKIESFINDYNTLIGEINTQYYTSYDNDYQPLTDAEKKAMSDSDISSWNAKAQTGLLHGDDNLDKLASQMKEAMSTFMKSSGVDLESFGITPVDDYTTKNGTYTIDSDKLTAALEDQTKFSKIQSLFCDGSSNVTSLTTSNSNTDGIAARLKVAININVTTPTSIFSELCGTENNPGTLTTNEFYKELQEQSDVITNYQTQLSDQETALYNKYSQLESQLTELQSSSSVFSSSK